MSLRSSLKRFGITAATGGALIALTATGTAIADDDDEGQNQPTTLTKGKITAQGGLLLRDGPGRGYDVIRTAPLGEVVTIFCKVKGESIDHNSHWYLLTDGNWAWGSARYIEALGKKKPKWC